MSFEVLKFQISNGNAKGMGTEILRTLWTDVKDKCPKDNSLNKDFLVFVLTGAHKIWA